MRRIQRVKQHKDDSAAAVINKRHRKLAGDLKRLHRIPDPAVRQAAVWIRLAFETAAAKELERSARRRKPARPAVPDLERLCKAVATLAIDAVPAKRCAVSGR